MLNRGQGTRKAFSKEVKIKAADIAGSVASFRIYLGSPDVVGTTAFVSALAATTYTGAIATTGDVALVGSIVIPGSTTTVAGLVTAIDGTTGIDATLVPGNSAQKTNSYIQVVTTAAASTVTGINWAFASTLNSLINDLSAKLPAYPANEIKTANVVNGTFHKIVFTPSANGTRDNTKATFFIDLGDATLTAASTISSTGAASSNIVTNGVLDATYAVTITAARTLISQVVSDLDGASGVSALFIPGSTGVSAKIQITLDTAGETALDLSDFIGSGKVVTVLQAAISSNVQLGTVVNGTSAFDNFNFALNVRASTGEIKTAGIIAVYDRSVGTLSIYDGTTSLAANDSISYVGTFNK
jgi:hypothetical protein